MSLKGRLRRLEAGVRWLETEGTFLRIEGAIKLLEMKQEIADRIAADPVAAARWNEDSASCPLPPPSVKARPRVPEPKPEPVAPRKEARVEPASAPAQPPPEECAAPAPPPESPPEQPPPDMEIRPVRWVPVHERVYEYDDEAPGTNGRCITEYDPLRGAYDDDDDDG